jgi:hypothetical protein
MQKLYNYTRHFCLIGFCIDTFLKKVKWTIVSPSIGPANVITWSVKPKEILRLCCKPYSPVDGHRPFGTIYFLPGPAPFPHSFTWVRANTFHWNSLYKRTDSPPRAATSEVGKSILCRNIYVSLQEYTVSQSMWQQSDQGRCNNRKSSIEWNVFKSLMFSKDLEFSVKLFWKGKPIQFVHRFYSVILHTKLVTKPDCHPVLVLRRLCNWTQ